MATEAPTLAANFPCACPWDKPKLPTFDTKLSVFFSCNCLVEKNTKSEEQTDSAEGQLEANVIEVRIPTCYQHAIRSKETSEWCDAMDREISVMIERKVWYLVDSPENAKVLGNLWVYTLKRDYNNRAVRFTAHLVARGNTQLSLNIGLNCYRWIH
ncbi:hypothetical protein AVEN_264111-1 [Araneus ventricosus]|uniref:Reverse transcriptase Ty1/copia-type domain-containing protein n=1 Tax=Araneus ventricosus TaxID=182803 RepID=A0A4Y2VJQ0_ARAVE|nr:hypothetical protein AVEN_264111-1 [Araneus ventricosus]